MIARKLADFTQSPFSSYSEDDDDDDEYVPVQKSKRQSERKKTKLQPGKVERPREYRKSRNPPRASKMKEIEMHESSSSEDEKIGIVRKTVKYEKTPVLHKKAENKIAGKMAKRFL